MKIHAADYVKSAPGLKECPEPEGLPEIALVGRSNVGKSSFINSLTRRKNLARTSNTPGKTRYLNYYRVSYSDPAQEVPQKTPEIKSVWLVDLPGYGYAKVSKREQAAWRRHLEAYLKERDIRLVVQLIDARHGALDSDIRMYEWLQYQGRRTLVVLTKADKLSRNEAAKQAAATARALDIAQGDILIYSSETHMARDEAWRRLEDSFPAPVTPTPEA